MIANSSGCVLVSLLTGYLLPAGLCVTDSHVNVHVIIIMFCYCTSLVDVVIKVLCSSKLLFCNCDFLAHIEIQEQKEGSFKFSSLYC